MEDGARLVLRTSAALKAGERVLIVADEATRTVGEAFATAAREGGTDPVLLVIGPRKADAEEPPEPVATAMQASDLILLVTRRSLTHTHARRAAIRSGARVISVPGATEDMLRDGGLATDWAAVHEAVRRAARRLRGAREVRVTSAGGTDLSFRVEGREWIAEDTGLCARKGAFTTLPAGELFVAPMEGTAEGRLVADVFFAEPLKEPATATVRQGHAERVLGAPKAVHEMNSGGREGRALGRFGFGLNPRARIAGPPMEAEKTLGSAHLGFGDNLAIGGTIHCGVHVECILSDVSIAADGKAIVAKGRLAD